MYLVWLSEGEAVLCHDYRLDTCNVLRLLQAVRYNVHHKRDSNLIDAKDSTWQLKSVAYELLIPMTKEIRLYPYRDGEDMPKNMSWVEEDLPEHVLREVGLIV